MTVTVTVDLEGGPTDAARHAAEFARETLSPYKAQVATNGLVLSVTFGSVSLDQAFNAVHVTLGIALDAGVVAGAEGATIRAYRVARP